MESDGLWHDGSIDKMLVLQAHGPGFDPQNSHLKALRRARWHTLETPTLGTQSQQIPEAGKPASLANLVCSTSVREPVLEKWWVRARKMTQPSQARLTTKISRWLMMSEQ